ncbi:MAG: YbgC/FadM family acyl-CoA thioesterase [Oceanicoccus sp.]
MASSSVLTTFEWPLRVYIEDTDAGGIVYYVNYLKYIERARTEFMRSLGFGKDNIFSTELMFVVHSLSSEYKKPARLDDELIVTARIVKTGKTYMVMAQDVYKIVTGVDSAEQGEARELLCRAEVKLACVKQQSIKPHRIPEVMLAVINRQVG